MSKLYKENKDYNQADLDKIRKELKNRAPLETFKFKSLAPGDQWIDISTPEFTAICPFSDFPDFGSVSIRYVPDKVCLELKSFKLYINAFRDVKIFHEAVTEVIFADFLKAVKPKKAHITVDMNVRGNVKTVCEKCYKC
ncbi:preQ(1) synthase [Patescibacteria group bacterium]|nr:preQ(1) synthase [Patescibacteria group bacterium]MBU1683257.1 preQ(1) synthase [Patescibacteria group bacterium]MBU1934978.1 preQ(1) synthase [Patescibacteria group bacterium]